MFLRLRIFKANDRNGFVSVGTGPNPNGKIGKPAGAYQKHVNKAELRRLGLGSTLQLIFRFLSNLCVMIKLKVGYLSP